MQALDAILSATPATDPWPARRQRTDELASRYPHAAEMLRLYRALLDPMADAFDAARADGPAHADLPLFAVQRVLPGIIDATIEAGPSVLRDGVIALFASADPEGLMQHWINSEALLPVETYLARAACGPLLEALAFESICLPRSRGRAGEGASRCGSCGGLPQLSYHALSGEPLVSGPRYLLCSRCSQSWVFSRMTCASCGESNGTRLPIYQEAERFPHARVDGCSTCRRYLLTFDLRRDSRAVPIVDELACLPLDLYARDQGLTKIAPNLMGN